MFSKNIEYSSNVHVVHAENVNKENTSEEVLKSKNKEIFINYLEKKKVES